MTKAIRYSCSRSRAITSTLHHPYHRGRPPELSASASAQVFVTTHSPVLISHFGFDDLHPLQMNGERKTERQAMDLGDLTDPQLRALLHKYGLRVTEPLLARRIVVCEGPSDAVVLSRLIERRRWRDPGSTRPRDGRRLGAQQTWQRSPTSWTGSASTGGPSSTGTRYGGTRRRPGGTPRRGAASLLRKASVRSSRPWCQTVAIRWLKKTLLKLSESSGASGQAPSALHGLKASKVSSRRAGTHQVDSGRPVHLLVSGLSQEQVTVFRRVPAEYNVWLWQTDLEHEMIGREGAADVV